MSAARARLSCSTCLEQVRALQSPCSNFRPFPCYCGCMEVDANRCAALDLPMEHGRGSREPARVAVHCEVSELSYWRVEGRGRSVKMTVRARSRMLAVCIVRSIRSVLPMSCFRSSSSLCLWLPFLSWSRGKTRCFAIQGSVGDLWSRDTVADKMHWLLSGLSRWSSTAPAILLSTRSRFRALIHRFSRFNSWPSGLAGIQHVQSHDLCSNRSRGKRWFPVVLR